ncbi:efflux RND transporter permease subunit [Klebsiella pneumoniae]|nr:efflux RND transporter permease subunit [Klebsiella pneumoniae]
MGYCLFIVLTGLLSIPRLPVAQYPEVAPPGIIISVSYPGASPEVMNTSVVSLIEREIRVLTIYSILIFQ